jgi:IS5 family transposase
MGHQMNLSDLEYSQRKRITKREQFLDCMDEITPWDEIVEMIKPYYYKNKVGRPARGIETMFRMYLLQTWYSLSDECLEDAIYDSYAMRKFMHLDFMKESVPDATTLCKFRKIIVQNGLAQEYFKSVDSFLKEHGYMMQGGTIVDATLIDAPKSTKNASQERDPEMHQTKKGNQWYFGAKMHVGVDAGTGFVHSLEVTSGNVADAAVAAELIREDDEVVYGDSAYCALSKHEEFKNDEHLSKLDIRTNQQKPYRKIAWTEGVGTFWLRKLEFQKSRVRCKVEYVFHVVKDIFGFRKTPYRGLKKLEARTYMLMASANMYMLLSANPTLRELPRENCA